MLNPRTLEKQYDLVVVGGGLSGMFAAVAAARNGAKTAIVQARSMFGGNASSEVRMHIVGAGCHNAKKDLNETGLIMELLLTNKRRNPYAVFPVWDGILWEMVRFQPNLDSYLNTAFEEARMEDGRITAIECFQHTTETRYVFHAPLFIDATGHGSVGAQCGAEARMGSEGKAAYNEPNAPDEPNSDAMGCTLMFQAINRGEPVKFEKPHWAYSFSEDDLKYRPHYNETSAMGEMGAPTEFKPGEMKALPHFSTMDAGYWWIELGGQYDHIIYQAEEIRDELMRCVYGVWDHIKNCGDHGAANYDLEWVGMVPGFRESRRLMGDYVLTEIDVRENRVFDDAVAYGGWPMDEHVRGGILDFDKLPSRILNFDGAYTIPYRCFYSKNIENLMMAGRDISCSKLAFGSTRVMGTCAVGGQAAGTAAALALKYGVSPRALGEKHIVELQQALLRDDCYIPGFKNEDPADMARGATATASSQAPGSPAANVLNGVSRDADGVSNAWESGPLDESGAWLSLDLGAPAHIQQVRLTFDPNLTEEIMPSITSTVRERQVKGLPLELVRDYDLALTLGGETVFERSVQDNAQRLNVIDLDQPVRADALRLTVKATYGHPTARVFEIRLY
jgi:hypothetical protein